MMPVYKDYIVKQGDTIESIAQQYLGSASRAPELVSLNRLRPPYIAVTSADFLGIPKVSTALQDVITSGSTSFDASKYIASNLISPLILTEKTLFYIKSNTANGTYVEDKMSIKAFYPNAVPSNNIAANTVVFDTATINPPSNTAESNNLLSKFYQFTIVGSISGKILTVHSISSGFISVGMEITGELIPANTIISAFGTGRGGVGTYTLSYSYQPNITPVNYVSAGSQPSDVAYHPTGKFLFACDYSTGAMYTYKVDTVTGALSFAYSNTNNASINLAQHIKCHPSGKFLFTTHNSNIYGINVWEIDQTTGALTFIQYYSLADFPGNIDIDYTGNFLLVVTTNTDTVVSSYKINLNDGTLAYKSSITISGSQCKSIACHPSKMFVTICYKNSTSFMSFISTYSINNTTGDLLLVNTFDPLPSLNVNTTSSDMIFHPNGNYLFIANYGPVTSARRLNSYSFDSSSGSIITLNNIMTIDGNSGITGNVLHSLACSRDGNYIFATNSSSTGGIYMMSINSTSGVVSYINRFSNPTNSCYGIDISPSGDFISCAGYGNNQVWSYSFDVITANASYQTLSGKIPSTVSLAQRNYFVQYTYNSINGETIASPLNINKINGAAIPFTVESKYLLAIEPPTAWPTAATSVNIYIGTSPTSLRYQATLSSINSMFVEPIVGFSFTGRSTPSANTAYVGFSHTYQPGTIFSIHTNPAQFGTRVLGVGDLMHLPSENTVAISSLFNNKNPNKFFSALGVDMALNETGHLTFNDTESGDFLTVSGRDNIKQAIQSLLNTRLNFLKTRPNYGNSALNLIGEKYSTTFFQRLRSDIVRALSRDRRIYSIKSLDISYDRNTSAINITNLAIQTSSDGSSASVVTFLPIALPI